MAVASRTFLQLVEKVADNLQALEQGTLTAASSGSSTAANFPYKTNLANADANKYVGCQFYTTSGTAPTQNPQEITAYAPSTGVFTLGLASATPPDATSTFDIFKKGLTIADLRKAVNNAVRKMQYKYLVPVTMLVDGDCDTSGVASWGTVSNATATKVSGAATLWRGALALNIANSSANGYLPSAAVNVHPSSAYLLLAITRAPTGTSNLIAWDSTNSAEIESESVASYDWQTLGFAFTTPATCYQITVRLSNTHASGTSNWDDVILLPLGAREIRFPDWVTKPGQVIRVLRMPLSTAEEADELTRYSCPSFNVVPDMNNPNGMFKLKLPSSIQEPVWIEAWRNYADLSLDADTITADRHILELWATAEMLNLLINKAPGEEAKAWKEEWKRIMVRLAITKYGTEPEIKVGSAFEGLPGPRP